MSSFVTKHLLSQQFPKTLNKANVLIYSQNRTKKETGCINTKENCFLFEIQNKRIQNENCTTNL